MYDTRVLCKTSELINFRSFAGCGLRRWLLWLEMAKTANVTAGF